MKFTWTHLEFIFWVTKTFFFASAASADYAAEMNAITTFPHDEIISSLRLDAKYRKRRGSHPLRQEGTDSEKGIDGGNGVSILL